MSTGVTRAIEKPALGRVGAVGLGRMGAPMLARWLAAGHGALAWARRDAGWAAVVERLPPAARARLARAPTFGVLLEAADTLVLNVSDTPDVEALVGQALAHRRRTGRGPRTIVDHSTIDPESARRLGQRCADAGIEWIDAPVSGGVVGAEAGTLTVFLGGNEAACAAIEPWLRAVAARWTHLGPAGSGQVGKVANQILVGTTLAAIGDVLALAQRTGVDAARLREALLGGFAASKVLEHHGAKLIAGDARPGFSVALHAKDARIVERTLAECGLDTTLASVVREALECALAAGEAELDSSRLAVRRQRPVTGAVVGCE